jgi:hypothetical protein
MKNQIPQMLKSTIKAIPKSKKEMSNTVRNIVTTVSEQDKRNFCLSHLKKINDPNSLNILCEIGENLKTTPNDFKDRFPKKQATSKNQPQQSMPTDEDFENFKQAHLHKYTAYYLYLNATSQNFSSKQLKEKIYDQYGECQILPQINRDELFASIDQSNLQEVHRLIKDWASRKYAIQIQETSITDQMQKVLVQEGKKEANRIFPQIISHHS